MKVLLGVALVVAAFVQQEGNLPVGHWCQRMQTRMSKNAHVCGCRKADCAKDEPPSAREDPMCKAFCKPDACHCAVMDCQ